MRTWCQVHLKTVLISKQLFLEGLTTAVVSPSKYFVYTKNIIKKGNYPLIFANNILLSYI